MRTLRGKTAIVTGAGQGIGRGTAITLAERGARVMLTGRTQEKLAAVREEIQALGGEAALLPCDVGEERQVAEVVARTVELFGGVQILVNSAQSWEQKPLEETTSADIDMHLRSGTFGTYYAMKHCFPFLKEQGGSIVNFGSTSTIVGETTFGAYAVAKEAIRGLSKVAAREWGRYGIRVNVICPASMTPGAEQYAAENPDRFAAVLEQIPLGRLGDPKRDIGHAIAALVGDDMAYLTGATLMLNGGWVFLA